MAIFDDIPFMRDLERRFKQEFSLPDSDDRQTYKIYYSRLSRSDFLFLGINPGGDPESKDNFSASNAYFENWEHDFVEFRENTKYKLASPAYKFLSTLIGSSGNSKIAAIPATNLCFWRSKDSSKIPKGKPDHLKYVGEIIDYVNPRIIVLVSSRDKYFEFLARAAHLEQPQLLMPEVFYP